MDRYLKRITDEVLNDSLDSKGAVLIVGPKWCGKTTTAKQVAKTVIRMDNSEKTAYYQELACINPSMLLVGSTPVLIDEWHVAPSLWNAVRYEVDERDEFGQFILTGSAVPPTFEQYQHTGIGRISRMTMRPMSLYESEDSDGSVSLSDLFKQKTISSKHEKTLEDLAFYICRGGWPKAIGKSERVALRQALDYFDSLVSVDISNVDGVSKDEYLARRLLRSYARYVGTSSSLEAIRADLSANEGETLSKNTLYSYLNALKKIFVLEDSVAWNPNLRSKTAIRTKDTHYFVDPSIAAASLGVGAKELLHDLQTMGFLFENMCIRDLRIYSQLLDGEVFHYRDSTDLECDAVIRLRNGDYGLVEVKLGGSQAIAQGAETLKKLAGRIDTVKMKEPSFMAVVCGIAPFAYQREDGIYVVPIACLKS